VSLHRLSDSPVCPLPGACRRFVEERALIKVSPTKRDVPVVASSRYGRTHLWQSHPRGVRPALPGVRCFPLRSFRQSRQLQATPPPLQQCSTGLGVCSIQGALVDVAGQARAPPTRLRSVGTCPSRTCRQGLAIPARGCTQKRRWPGDAVSLHPLGCQLLACSPWSPHLSSLDTVCTSMPHPYISACIRCTLHP